MCVCVYELAIREINHSFVTYSLPFAEHISMLKNSDGLGKQEPLRNRSSPHSYSYIKMTKNNSIRHKLSCVTE